MIWIIRATIFAAFFLLTLGFVTILNRRYRVKVRMLGQGLMPESLLMLQKEKSSLLPEWLLNLLSFSGQWALPDLEKVSEMRKDLISAGYRHPQAPAIYLGLRIIMAFGLSLPVLLYFIIRGVLNPLTLGLAFIVALFGFFLVSKILSVKIRQRQENLDRSLPDIIDLFVVCMEAGLSLNAALQRVSEEIHGVYRDFSDELQITAKELRAGIPWDEAFDNLGKRTNVQSIRSMVGLMIQSNKLGASISDALRHHADFIRTQRILIAEEKAAKLSLKMIFPLIFFIMPAILIVAAGPGLIHVFETFFRGEFFQGGAFQIR
jgi:tight adherence protein C